MSTSDQRRLETYADAISTAKTVVWNGPMGIFEVAGVCVRYE